MKQINKTLSLMIKHANSLKNLLSAYHSTEATALSKILDQIIEKLQDPHANPNACLDLIIFTICLLPGNRLSIANRRIRFAVYDYYKNNMRDELVREFQRVKEQIERYKDYRDRISLLEKTMSEKFTYGDKLIEKNTSLIIDLKNSLYLNYHNLVTKISLITENNIKTYQDITEKLQNCEIGNLKHNKKIFDLKEKLNKKFSELVKQNYVLWQKDVVVIPIPDVIDHIISFTEKQNDEMIHDFISINYNQNEIGIIEWLIQNHFINEHVGEGSVQQKYDVDIKACMAEIKENFLTLFSNSSIETSIEYLETWLENLEKEKEAVFGEIRKIRCEELEVTQQLMLLKDSMKELNLYVTKKDVSEKKKEIPSKKSSTFGTLLQIFTPTDKDDQQRVNSHMNPCSEDSISSNPDLVDVSTKSENDESGCCVM